MNPKRKARLQEWRKQLEAADPRSRLGGLEAAHRSAGLGDGQGYEFNRDWEDASDSELLDLIHMMLQAGVMPPPEFLLTLVEDWRAYLAAKGDQTLELHLIGPPVPRAGNYARRCATKATRQMPTALLIRAPSLMLKSMIWHGVKQISRKERVRFMLSCPIKT